MKQTKFGLGRVRSNGARNATFSFLVVFGLTQAALASTAYGSINNFDCVNDTGSETHGFEIEIDYGHTTDVTYTYDYNHYGTPKVSEDLSDPMHPRVFVRYESAKNLDGTWKAYTAIPSGPILPTQGHQFTNPAINFGGEHFGVGFIGTPVAVKYNWLLDDGAGNLVHGPAVYIATPTFTYSPPVGIVPAQVVAAIVPPPPPAAPVFEFGVASWVKEIKTSSHNPGKVHLNDLVGDDPGHPQPWANGEPDEVEVEWKILQTEFAAANGGKNNELKGKGEDLPGGDEVITRRYEFFKYVGPIDAETGEAVGDTVGADGKHGVGTVTYADHFDNATGEWVTVTVNLSNVIIVGDFFGAQMAGFDAAPILGLIDHIQDGELGVDFPARTVVVGGADAFLATIKSGTLPTGLTLDEATGVLSGTPSAAGSFAFTVEATDLGGADVLQSYTLVIPGEAPATFAVAASVLPASAGRTHGTGTFNVGTNVTLGATAKAGFVFSNWTDGLTVVSDMPRFSFLLDSNRTFVANFLRECVITTASLPVVGGTTTGAGTFNSGSSVALTATANPGFAFDKWTFRASTVSTVSSYTFVAAQSREMVANFLPTYTVSPVALPSIGGTVIGGGTYKQGTKALLIAKSVAGYRFTSWSEVGVIVSTVPRYTITVSANHTLEANFTKR
jgi:Putative Ig domain/Divergent InlB B-repeat domain